MLEGVAIKYNGKFYEMVTEEGTSPCSYCAFGLDADSNLFACEACRQADEIFKTSNT